MENLHADNPAKIIKKSHTAVQQIKNSTSEILGDIVTRLHGGDDNEQSIIDNPHSFLDAETFKNYEKHIGKNVELPLSRISLIDNVRNSINIEDDDFQKLLADISKNGIQQNIIVELIKNEHGGQLVCVAGHRRVTAAMIAGNITHVPALIKKFKNRGDRTQSALAENLLRKDLHCLDVADGYQRMIDEGWGKDDLVEIFDRNEKTVRRYLKMAQWPKEAKDLIRSNIDKFSARVLLNNFASKKFDTDQDLIQGLQLIANNNVSMATKKKANLKDRIEMVLEDKNLDSQTKAIVRDVFASLGLVSYV